VVELTGKSTIAFAKNRAGIVLDFVRRQIEELENSSEPQSVIFMLNLTSLLYCRLCPRNAGGLFCFGKASSFLAAIVFE